MMKDWTIRFTQCCSNISTEAVFNEYYLFTSNFVEKQHRQYLF